jgi:hypothetical protein
MDLMTTLAALPCLFHATYFSQTDPMAVSVYAIGGSDLLWRVLGRLGNAEGVGLEPGRGWRCIVKATLASRLLSGLSGLVSVLSGLVSLLSGLVLVLSGLVPLLSCLISTFPRQNGDAMDMGIQGAKCKLMTEI